MPLPHIAQLMHTLGMKIPDPNTNHSSKIRNMVMDGLKTPEEIDREKEYPIFLNMMNEAHGIELQL